MNHPPLQHALTLFQTGRYHDTALFCQQVLTRTQGDESLATLWAMSLQHLGREDEAAILYRQLATANPHAAGHWANLGLMQRRLGEYADSENAYRQALALEPDNVDLLVDYGLLLLDMGRIADARHRFLDATDLRPDSSEARIYGSLACFECGDAQRAAALIPPASSWPQLPDYLQEELASALIRLGRTDEAEALLAAPGIRQSLSGIIRMAQLNERMNRTAQAIALIQEAQSLMDGANRQERMDLLQLQASLALREKKYSAARNRQSYALVSGKRG